MEHTDEVREGAADSVVTFDRDDTRPLTPADKERLDVAETDPVSTFGNLASENIFALISSYQPLKNFVLSVISDPGHFQGPDWEKEVKNSKPGALSTSATE